MKALVQRVKSAKLTVDEKLISEINKGLVCYLGIGKGDTEKESKWLSNKMYESFCNELKNLGISKVAKGVFGADMQIIQENDGPVTIMIDTSDKAKTCQ